MVIIPVSSEGAENFRNNIQQIYNFLPPIVWKIICIVVLAYAIYSLIKLIGSVDYE